VISLIRSRWSDVGILVRGDSAYAREEIMQWCESEVGVDYVFGLSKNSRLITMTLEIQRQLRLWFSSVAYVLMNALRSRCLASTELGVAQVGTIRTKLLKLGARLLVSARRVLVSISNGCPYQDIFATAYRCLQTLPHPG
jgi:hypothetical protein